MTSLDDMPVGSSNVIMPEEQPQVINLMLTESLETRLHHKLWQVRSCAFDELLSNYSDEIASDLNLSKEWPKYLNDNNLQCLEKSFKVLNYSLTVTKIDKESVKDLIDAIIYKGVASPKSNIKSLSTECLINLITISQEYDLLITCLSSYLSKSPKFVLAGTISLNAVIDKIGIKQFSHKHLFSYFEKQSCSANPSLRKEAMIFYKVAYKYLGTAIASMLNHLKQSQKEEILGSCEPIAINPVISTAIDIYDVHADVDCLPKISQEWCKKYNELKAWKDKKLSLEKVYKIINVPKIKPPLPSFIVNHLENILKEESNISVIQLCLKIIVQLGNGLRAQFQYWKRIVIVIIGMYRERKLEDDINKVMDALRWCIKIEELLDTLMELLCSEKSKQINPHMKKSLITWIGTYMEFKEANVSNNVIVSICELLTKLSNDSIQEVREAALWSIGVIKLRSSVAIDSIINELSPQKKGKIEEICSTKKSVSPAAKKQSTKSPSSSNLNSVKLEMDEIPINEADKVLSEVVDIKVLQYLNSSALKEKKIGMSMLSDLVNEQSTKSPLLLKQMHEYYIRYIKKILKDWKEQSSQPIMLCLSFLNTLLSLVEIEKRAANYIFNYIIEKCCDEKFRMLAESIVFHISDCIGPDFIVTKLVTCTRLSNQQTLTKEANSIMAKIINEYPLSLLPIKLIVDYSKKQLTLITKQGAVEILKKLFFQMGDSFRAFISDLNEITHRWLNEELHKEQYVKESHKTRRLRGEAAKLLSDSGKDDNNAEQKIERTDISIYVTTSLIRNIESDKWNVRNEALNQIQAILTNANFMIQSNNLNELFKSIGNRIKDSHKGIQKGYISLITTLSEAIGSKVKQYYRFILPNLIDALADKQPSIRVEASAAITKLGEMTGTDYIINALALCIQRENPELRIESLQWLTKEGICFDKCDHMLLLPGIIHCLLDKTIEVRKLADKLLEKISPYINKDDTYKYIRDQKPTVQLQLMESIDKYFTPSRLDNPNSISFTYLHESNEEVTTEESQAQPFTKKLSTSNLRNSSKSNSPKLPEDAPKKRANPKIKSVKRSKILLYNLDNKLRHSSVSPKQHLTNQSNNLNNRSTLQSPMSTHKLNQRCSDNLLYKSNITLSLAFSEGRIGSDPDLSSKFKPIMLNYSKDKQKRVENDKKYPWIATEIKGDAIENLKRSLKPLINPNLFNLMFAKSNNSKLTVECINAFAMGLDEEYVPLSTIIDMLLKWMGCKILYKNATITKAVMEFISKLIAKFIQTNSKMCEYESRIVLLILAEQICCKSTSSKEIVGKLIVSTVEVCQIQTILKVMICTIRAKNHKEKIECLYALSNILSAVPSLDNINEKDFQYICSLQRENEYRMAVNSIVGEFYRLNRTLCEANLSKSNMVVEVTSPKYEPMHISSSCSFHPAEQEKLAPVSRQSNKTPGVDTRSMSTIKFAKPSPKKVSSPPQVVRKDTSSISEVYGDIPILISSIIEMVKSKDAFVSIMMKELIRHPNLPKLSNPNELHDLMLALTTYVIDGMYSIKDDIEELCRITNPLVLLNSIIDVVPRQTQIVCQLQTCIHMLLRRLNSNQIEYIFELLDANIGSSINSEELNAFRDILVECVEIHGAVIWQCVKQHTKRKVSNLVDEIVYSKFPEFESIIKMMKTRGTKGVAGLLKTFAQSNEQLNFEKILARCSLILMQQIKDEMEEDKVSIMPSNNTFELKPSPIFSTIPDSYTLKDKLANSRGCSPPLHISDSEKINVEERFKELSKEIMKMKSTGGL